jgi:transposase-like protein
MTADPDPIIDYKNLRRLDPEAARQAVLDYLEAVDGNVSAAARAFDITRNVVYDIRARARDGALADRSRRPHHQPTRTPPDVEDRVIAARNRTRLGYERLAKHLAAQGLRIPWPTVRNILKRNRHRLTARARRPAPYYNPNPRQPRDRRHTWRAIKERYGLD